MTSERRPGQPNRDPSEGAADHVNVPPTDDERHGRYPSGSPADEAVRERNERARIERGRPVPRPRDRDSGGK